MSYFSNYAGKTRSRMELLLCVFAVFLSFSEVFAAELPPPVFIDPTPPDVTVGCYNDRPDPVILRAETVNGLVNVSPIDSLSNGFSTVCAGGVLYRIWEVTDAEGTTRTQRTITFGPSNDGPTFSPELEATFDTVECTVVNDPNNPLAYGTWLSTQQFRVINNSIPGCAPITSITNDGDSALEGPGCGDVVEVTFTVADQCNVSIQITFTYVIIDTEAPVLSGVPNDVVINCEDPVPAPPTVTATDCGFPDAFPVAFSETDNQAFDGSCNEFEFDIFRTWTSSDSCGNTTIESQTISVVDNTAPTFTRPPNIDLQCFDDFESLAVTGEPTALDDNCTATANLSVTFTDVTIFQPDCNFNYNIRRSWTVTDRCGNASTQIQNIFVGDNLAPTFSPPADVVVNCEDIFNFPVVGEPTNLFDFCTDTPNTSFTDAITPGSCANAYEIQRTWRIFDECNNAVTYVQDILVIDTTPVNFITPPADLVTTCNNEQNQQQLFATWISNFAGAVARDACTPDDSLEYQIVVSGTNEVPLLPDFSCDAQDQTVRKLDVDVIVTDACGNVAVRTVQFRQVDTQAPNVFDCMPSQVVSTGSDECTAIVPLLPPTIVDQCVTGLPTQLNSFDTVAVTSDALPGQEGNTPVNPVQLVFPIEGFDLPVNALQPSTLTIVLENADAEGSGEVFLIYGEDGTLLDTTNTSDVQCSDVTTVVTLTRQQFNQWATDGMIIITLEPNIPGGVGGSFAINDLCPGGTRVLGQLFTPIRRLAPLQFEIIVDGEQSFLVDPVDTLFAELEQGLHQITYRVTDCAGNIDECVFTVTVEDQIAPELTCPTDVQLMLAADSCSTTFTVPLPERAVDNCSPYEIRTLESPLATADRFFRFSLDPNLGTFQADAITASFPSIDPFTVDSTVITVHLQGDFSGTSAILDVYDNDGQLLGSSPADLTDCDSGSASFKIFIAATTFNALVADGDFGLLLQPREVTVPPGQPGDGVNPCGDNVTQTGDIDSISFAYVELSYNLLRPAYFTTGATVTPLEQTDDEQPVPVLTLNQGVTVFNYLIADASGNADTCSFNIEVIDGILPTALCRPTTIFVDPSGLDPISIDPALIDDGSSDNCTIDTITLTPATFGCDDIGTIQNVTLRVVDASGNVDSCTTTVGVNALRPVPTANSGFCGGDSLFLFANPPTVAAPGQVIYTFEWFGPDNLLFSTDENPVIPGINSGDEGPYRVEITGISGCMASGVVNVNIVDLPITPVITAPQSVCIGEPIPLATPTNFVGTVEYLWFEGLPGSGTLLGSSPVPEFMVPGPHGNGGRNFYLQVTVNGCPSGPSTQISVTTVVQPSVMVDNQTIIACELSTATLSVQPQPNLIFQWTGPNGFTAQGQEINIGPLNGNFAGVYYVQSVLNGGCFSAADSLIVAVVPASPQPSIASNGPVCLGTPLELTASVPDGETYVFMAPNGQTFSTDTATLILEQAIPGYAGNWTVTADLGTCPSAVSNPVAVVVNSLPTAGTQLLPDPVCTGNNLILQGSSTATESTYAWTGPDGFTSTSIAPVLNDVSTGQSGMYVLTVTDPNGCQDNDTLVVDVLTGIEVQDIILADATCLNGGETVGLVAVTNPANTGNDFNYQWSGPGGITGSGDTLFIPDVTPMSSGTYSVTVTNQEGCISPVGTFIVDLQFAPETPLAPTTLDGEIGYCVDDSFVLSTTDYGPNTTYFWELPNGSTIPTTENQIELLASGVLFSGNYRVRVVRDGCSSPLSAPLMVTVTEFPPLNITAQTPVCEGSPIILQVTDLPGAQYSWRGPNNFSSSLPSPIISTANPNVHSGLYEVVATIGGCASDTIGIMVEVQPKPDIPVGVPQLAICIDDPLANLDLIINPNTATPGATYQWFTENGTIAVTDPGQGDTTIITDFSLFPNGGLVSFFAQANLDGCTSNLSNALQIRLDIADVDAAQLGPDTTICEGLYLLQAVPPLVGSGRWELLSGGGDIFIANPNSATTAVNGMSEFGSPYTYLWALSNGECKDYSRDTIVINITSGEEALAGPDLLVCLQDEIRLMGSPVVEANSVGSWSQNLAQEILGVEIVDPLDPMTEIQGLEANNVYSFTWQVESDCGIKTDVMLVNISDPAPFAGDDLIVCNSERSTVIAADEPTIGSAGRWRTITPGIEVTDPESPTTMVTNLMEGDNLLVWEIDEGLCGEVGIDTLVVVYKSPAIPLDDELEVPFQGTVTFDPLENDEVPPNSTPQLVEEVSIGSLTIAPNGQFTYVAPPNFVGEVTAVYLLLSDGCTASSATIRLLVGTDAACTAPNIFTPNNDGVNDFFVVPCLLEQRTFPNSQVTIYNQWGDEIFRSRRPYDGDFDGTYNGEELPVGTYFYQIDFGNDRPTQSGHVRIQR